MGCIRERDIGGWPICVGYGILTVSDQSLGYCGSGYPRLAPRSVSSSRSRAVAAGLVFAAAADRQVAAMRECRRQIERPPRRRHIRSSLRRSPSPRVALRHQLRAGREVGKPNIEPVVGRIAFLPNATRRTPHRAESELPLATRGFTQVDDPQGHDVTIAVRARAGLLFVFRPAGPMWANG